MPKCAGNTCIDELFLQIYPAGIRHKQKVAGCPGNICPAGTDVKRRKLRSSDLVNGI